jgi:Flp pilus assembly protein TadD
MGGETGRAIVSFERALALDPTHLRARENLAGMLASSGDFEESVVHYRRALEQVPEDPATRFLLARALAALDRPAEARHELEQVLALEPGHREARLLLQALEDPVEK